MFPFVDPCDHLPICDPQIVNFLDSVGASTGVALRRNPLLRIGFAVYILLIHLWVLYVFYHFTHHPAFESHTTPPGSTSPAP